MKKFIISVIAFIMALGMILSVSACNGTKPNVESPPAGEYNDPAMDDIYE